MLKKFLVTMIALMGVFSVGYTYYNLEMNALTTSKNAGVSATGRIGNLKKGDKILLGLTNAQGEAIGWQLIKDLGSNHWFTMSTEAVGRLSNPIDTNKYTNVLDHLYTNSYIKPYITALNNKLQSSDLSIEKSMSISRIFYEFPWKPHQVLDPDESEIFIPNIWEFQYNSSYDLYIGAESTIMGDLSFKEDYYLASIYGTSEWRLMGANGGEKILSFPNSSSTEVAIRPGAKWNLENVVFSLSDAVLGNGNIIEIQEPSLPSGGIMKDYTGDEMKIRLLDSAITVNLDDLQIDGIHVSKVQSDNKIDVQFSNASIGNNQVLSVLITDANTNKFLYYKQLGTVKSNGTYELDLKDIPIGKYNIQLVNEVVTNTYSPTYASALTSTISLEIVPELTIAVIPSPQGQSAFEYSKNVNQNTQIATITTTGGVSPINFVTVSDTSVPGHENDYQKFDVLTTGSSPIVVVKDSAGLSAGDYYFKVKAYDTNDTASGGVDSTTVHIVVNKTQPTITFSSDDQGTTYVKGNVSNTVTHSESATHTSSDQVANDAGVEYSIVSDSSSILSSGLPFTSQATGDTADIVFKANMSGSVKIQAVVPESTNYKEAKTTKTIKVQLGLSGEYAEDQTGITAGSTYAKPPASYSQANRIGHITVSGGTPQFTYNLPSGKGNNGSFHIDASGNIYVNQSVTNGLAPGDYDIEVEITDNTSPTKQTVTVKKTITVLPATLSGVTWIDPSTGSALNGNKITVTYDPSKNGGSIDTKVTETTQGSLANTTITYTLDPDPNTVITTAKNGDQIKVTIQKASDTTTKDKVKIIATIKGGMYGNSGVTTEVYVNVKKYTQTIAFTDATRLKLPVGSPCVKVEADVTSTHQLPNGLIQYTSSNTNANAPFTINANGEVCPTANSADAGSASLTGTLLGNDNFTEATTGTPKVIEIYVPGAIDVTGSIQNAGTANVTYTPGTMIKAHDKASNENGTATPTLVTGVARIQDTGSSNPVYVKSTNKTAANADASLFTVTPTGYIKLNQNIYANDIINHGTGNIYYIQVDVTDDNNFTKTVDIQIVIDDATADFYFRDPISGDKLTLDHVYHDGKTKIAYYKTDYAPNGTIDVQTNLGSTYSEDTKGDQDVIDHANGGTFSILNASDASAQYGGTGGDTYVQACMNKVVGYSEQCIYAQVEILQAEQTGFAFVHSPLWTVGKTPAIIEPLYNNHLSTGDVVLTSSDNTIAEGLAPVPGSNQSFKTTGKTGTVTLTATAQIDRNYKQKTATTSLTVSEKPPTTLTLFVPTMTYGDTTGKLQIIAGYKPGVPAYFYVDDPTILTVDPNPVNTKDSLDMSAIRSGQVTVSVCQTNDPFDPAIDDCNAIGGDYGELKVTVKKKPITLTYNDESIYTGEFFPTYTLKDPGTGSFAYSDHLNNFVIPSNTSARQNGSPLSDTNTKGTYDIIGEYSEIEKTDVMKNYNITLEKGTLIIKQDVPVASWYHLEDQSGTTVNSTDWHNDIITVVLDSAIGSAGSYDQISDTINFTNADKTKFTVNKEDENNTDIYFSIDPTGNEAHKGAISEKTQTLVKIDMTKPVINSITGYPVNNDGLSDFLNQITLGKYFKPGVEVIMNVTDPKPGEKTKPGKESGIKEINYQVYELDEKGIMKNSTPIDTGSGTSDSKGNISFKINEIGNYRVCATAIDLATNPSVEKCSDLNIKKIDIDVDGDNKPDFNDPDNDGCPDLNIKWKDPNDDSKWVIINGDRNQDGIPDLNIDSNGDGKADLNIDTDHDGKPDLNLVILKKTDWVPEKCVLKDESKGIMEEYCTGTSVKAQINVDITGDNIPDINIDNIGDFKPHLNISTNGKDAIVNITTIHEWKPNHDYTSNRFLYDSIGTDKDDPKPHLNIDTDGDGRPDVNIDLNNDGKPDLNIDYTGDNIPDTQIDSSGDGKPDINIDLDGNGIADENIIAITEWKPEKNVDGDILYDTMEITGKGELEDNGIVVEKPDGTFLPNFAIKVDDVTETKREEVIKEASDEISETQEVKAVYDVKLLENDVEVQPDGTLKVRIPIPEGITNPKLLIKRSNGTYETVTVKEENGYLVYETNELGIVSVIGDKVDTSVDPEPTPKPAEPEPTDDPAPSVEEPATSKLTVQGTYTNTPQAHYPGNNVGGASTGDTTNPISYLMLSLLCLGLCKTMYVHKRR